MPALVTVLLAGPGAISVLLRNISRGTFSSTLIMDVPTQDETLYTVAFTFHRGTNMPVADINNLSCDPYIDAHLAVPAHPHHVDHPLRFRTPTVRHNLNPGMLLSSADMLDSF